MQTTGQQRPNAGSGAAVQNNTGGYAGSANKAQAPVTSGGAANATAAKEVASGSAIKNASQVRRPTPAQSERDIGATLPPEARAQVSYKNGKEVPYGTAGSVRPDWCIGNSCSIEVKNYNIATNSNNLVNNVSKQAIERANHLPKGMVQTVVIDIRGQTVTAKQEFVIKNAIFNKTNGLISKGNIIFEGLK